MKFTQDYEFFTPDTLKKKIQEENYRGTSPNSKWIARLNKKSIKGSSSVLSFKHLADTDINKIMTLISN